MKTRTTALLLALVLAAACTGCKEKSGQAKENVDPPEVKKEEKEKTLVVVAPLQRGAINSYIDVSSDIESLNVVDIYPHLGGLRIEQVAMDEGDLVNPGDLLVRLDKEEIVLEYEQANAEFEEAEKQALKATLAVKEAAERIKVAEIQKKKLYNDFKITESIAEDSLVSKEKLAADRLTWEQADSALALRALEREKAAMDAELAVSAKEKARIALKNSKLKLERTKVRSPVKGYISFRGATAGMTVTTSTRLCTIVDRETLVTYLYVPQEDLSRINAGMPVFFSCDAMPDNKYQGTVDLVSPVVDPTNGTIKIRVRLPSDPDGVLRPGMFISARILISAKKDKFLASRKATFYMDDRLCFFAVRDNKAMRIYFEQGASNSEVVEITNPRIESGDEAVLEMDVPIIIVGQDNLKDGDPIEIVEDNRYGSAPEEEEEKGPDDAPGEEEEDTEAPDGAPGEEETEVSKEVK